jgi:hypothetical protein
MTRVMIQWLHSMIDALCDELLACIRTAKPSIKLDCTEAAAPLQAVLFILLS